MYLSTIPLGRNHGGYVSHNPTSWDLLISNKVYKMKNNEKEMRNIVSGLEEFSVLSLSIKMYPPANLHSHFFLTPLYDCPRVRCLGT